MLSEKFWRWEGVIVLSLMFGITSDILKEFLVNKSSFPFSCKLDSMQTVIRYKFYFLKIMKKSWKTINFSTLALSIWKSFVSMTLWELAKVLKFNYGNLIENKFCLNNSKKSSNHILYVDLFGINSIRNNTTAVLAD